MLKWVRVATLLGALVLVGSAVLDFNPGQDLEVARRARRAKDHDQTLRMARRAAAWAWGDQKVLASSHELQARAAADLGRRDVALAKADRLVNLGPQQAGGWFLRGEIKYQLGDMAGAAADLGRGLELAQGKGSPASLAPRMGLRALALAQAGQDSGAEALARQALSLRPGTPRALQALSLALEHQGRVADALAAAEQALAQAQKRDSHFFMKPEGHAWLNRLVALRMRNKVNPTRRLPPVK